MPASEIPVYGGMLDLSPPIARCHRCGWEGVPTSWRGRTLDECPRCEGARAEDAAWVELLELIARAPLYRRLQRWGNLPLFRVRPRQLVAKQSRNSPCACGSGVKFKKCCGR